MKRRISLSVSILVPVLLGILLVQILSFLGAYLSVRNADINDARDVDEPVLREAARRMQMVASDLDEVIAQTKEIYQAEADKMPSLPTNDAERWAYRKKFYVVNQTAAFEHVNNQIDFEVLGEYTEFFLVGFIDEARNRFVVVCSRDAKPGVLSTIFTGYFFDLPQGCKKAEYFSGDIVHDTARESKPDGTYQDVGYFTSGWPATSPLVKDNSRWVLRQTNEEKIFNESHDFLVSFSGVAIATVASAIILFFVALHFGLLRPLNKMSARSNAYVQAMAAGKPETTFELSKKKYTNQIETLNDSMYYMQEEMKGFTLSIKEAASREERARTELMLAEKIQASMVPAESLIGDDFAIHRYMKPAREVGGDFYDYFQIDKTHVGFFIADVSGKGVPAALFMAKAAAVSRLLLGQGDVAKINEALVHGNDENLFVTAFFGTLNTETGELHYVNCGHEPVFIRSNGSFSPLPAEANLPLGCLEDIPYEVQTTQLHSGDMLFLYTDGLSEAMNEAGDLFGKEAIAATLDSLASCPGEAVIEGMKEAQAAFVKEAPQSDDTCFLCVEYGFRKTLQIPCNKDGLKKVSGFLDEALEGYDFTLVASLQVVLDELISNVVFYSGGSHISITLIKEEGAIAISILDDGTPFDPFVDRKEKDEDEPGGHGINLAFTMVDEKEYRHIGMYNLLRLRKYTG